MPRPNTAQLAYGSATVICSTLAMLLLSRTATGIGVAVIGIAGLLLGLLVAVTIPSSRRAKTPSQPAPASRASSSMGLPDAQIPGTRAHAGAETRIGEHSLRS
jgi:hypothetical protein